jgi:DNA replication protein DnaC
MFNLHDLLEGGHYRQSDSDRSGLVTAALLDRLTHHCHIIETINGDSAAGIQQEGSLEGRKSQHPYQ